MLSGGVVEKALIPEIDMEEVAEAWVKQYKTNQIVALRELINFVIRVRSHLCTANYSTSDTCLL